jgi:hypothetical protein
MPEQLSVPQMFFGAAKFKLNWSLHTNIVQIADGIDNPFEVCLD